MEGRKGTRGEDKGVTGGIKARKKGKKRGREEEVKDDEGKWKLKL